MSILVPKHVAEELARQLNSAEDVEIIVGVYEHAFEVSYTRDLWRFIKLLDENSVIEFTIERDPSRIGGILRQPWVIRYNHTEELGMEVYT